MYNTNKCCRLIIVIPCYNEETVLPLTAPQFLKKLYYLIENGKISNESGILFIDDGSKDKTWLIVKELCLKDIHYNGVSLSRNRGHQNALMAGLMEAKDSCDITVSIDCDGQDDLDAIDRMIEKYKDGYEIVYGVRGKRDKDTWFKRTTAEAFYHFMNFMGVESVYNHADFRLVSSRALNEFEKFHEVNLYLRGMIPMVGFPSTSVYYERKERLAGESHYPFSKMLSLAFDGITSLSIKPIHVITSVGFAITILSVLAVLWAVFCRFTGKTVSGWTSLICVICFFGGAILTSLGIIGEYVGKAYMEAKARPRYIISERTYSRHNINYSGREDLANE